MLKYQLDNSMGNYHYNVCFYPQHDADQRFKLHFHKNLELLVVLEGALHLTVNGSCEILSAGSMALVLSNQIHTFFTPKGSNVMVVVFSEDYVPKFANAVRGKQGDHFHFIPDDTVWNMVVQYLKTDAASVYIKKACLYGACGAYLEQAVLGPRSDKSDFLVGQMLNWIGENAGEDITLKQLAETFGYDYHYLSRLLTNEYGINFRQLVNQYRIDEAINLLESTDLPITQIALKSGFQNVRTFNHVFKEFLGHTPRAHRTAK
jgi:AraC-like DNA-binding protein/mannose-6-phosphate isomerase-like protein (cupin superfamily)